MAFLSSMDIAASGLTAQRYRMDVLAENIANANTTRTVEGGPYRKRSTVFMEREALPFGEMLSRSMQRDQSLTLAANDIGRGVRVVEVAQDDETPFKLRYDPEHPDAQADGYVRMPNVDIVTEMVDMMGATRSYEANITALDAIKKMATSALSIGK